MSKEGGKRFFGQHLTLIGCDMSTRGGLQVFEFQIPQISHNRLESAPLIPRNFSTYSKFGSIQVGTDSEGEEDEIFFIWPTTLVHKVTLP